MADPTPACESHLPPAKRTWSQGVDNSADLDPCRLCFHGERVPSAFDADELVVSHRNPHLRVHRPASSGSIDRDAFGGVGNGDSLLQQLHDETVTSVADIDFDRAGGDA